MHFLKIKLLITAIPLFCLFCLVCSNALAADDETRRLLLEIRGDVKTMAVELKATNQRLDEMDKRINTKIDETDKRINTKIDEMDKRINAELKTIHQRIDATNQRIEDIYKALGYLTAAFTAIVVASIGFAYWDRRTAVHQAKKETVAEIEAFGRLRDVISALRELAKKDVNVEGLLRQFHLL